MRKYLAFFRMKFTYGLQYRAAALAGIVTQFAWGLMEILVFLAFYDSSPEQFPMSFSAVCSYVWLQQAFIAFFAAWMMDGDIFQTIMDGNIAYELCRPVHIYEMWFFRSMADRMARAVLRCFPILLVAACLPEPYGIIRPNERDFLLFLLTLLLGLLVTVAFCMFVYCLAFFTISPEGLRILVVSMVEFFSGAILPLPFFPHELEKILELLPFASMQNVALRIYSGSMTQPQAIRAVLLQVFWLVLLVAGGRGLSLLAERRAVVQGG